MTATDIIHIIGTIAFTLSGYLVGVRKRLDILGIWICALLTAIGGGLLRDVVVGRTPVVFVEYSGLLVVLLTLLVAWLFKVQNNQRRVLSAIFVWADSLGLVAFTITGAQIGLQYHLNLFGVVMLGFMTAVGGGQRHSDDYAAGLLRHRSGHCGRRAVSVGSFSNGQSTDTEFVAVGRLYAENVGL